MCRWPAIPQNAKAGGLGSRFSGGASHEGFQTVNRSSVVAMIPPAKLSTKHCIRHIVMHPIDTRSIAVPHRIDQLCQRHVKAAV